MAVRCVNKKPAPPGFCRGAGQHLRAVELVGLRHLFDANLASGMLHFRNAAAGFGVLVKVHAFDNVAFRYRDSVHA